MELTHTDVYVGVELQPGEEFANEPFENTLTPPSTFTLPRFRLDRTDARA
jgi:hypothetical protein